MTNLYTGQEATIWTEHGEKLAKELDEVASSPLIYYIGILEDECSIKTAGRRTAASYCWTVNYFADIPFM